MIDSLWTERRSIVRVDGPPQGRAPAPRSGRSAARSRSRSARCAGEGCDAGAADRRRHRGGVRLDRGPFRGTASRPARSRPRRARTNSTTASASSRPMSSTIRSPPILRRSRFLRASRDAGKAEIGAHLHPWVTPPHRRGGQRPQFLSLQPAARARARQDRGADRGDREELRRAPDDLQGGPLRLRPRTPAGRWPSSATGSIAASCRTPISPATAAPISAAVPDRAALAAEGLLEVPLTVGFLGAMPGLGERAAWLFDSPKAARLRVPGRAGADRPRRPLAADPGRNARRPSNAASSRRWRARGHRIFSLTYHSPSLAAGPHALCARRGRISPASSPISSRC